MRKKVFLADYGHHEGIIMVGSTLQRKRERERGGAESGEMGNEGEREREPSLIYLFGFRSSGL